MTLGVVAVALCAGCSTSDATGPGAFDIPDVVLHPSSAVCANNPAGTYTVDFSIHLVNTTASDAAGQQDIGPYALTVQWGAF